MLDQSAEIAGPTALLANYASRLEFEAIPADVVERVKVTLLDTLAVSIAALATPDAERLLDAAFDFATEGDCFVPGARRSAGASTAALVWGTLSDVFELQDGWRFGGIHASLVIASSLPMAQSEGRSGRDLLTAIVSGYEVAHRVAWAVHPEHMGRGHMPNGTAGTVGSAAAAARLLRLNSVQMTGALGTAGFLLPYSTAETLWAGHSAKPLHTGWAARTGLEAAHLAKRSFYGCPLEGTAGVGRGFLQLAAESARPDRLAEGLGELYTLRDTYFKFYPVCRQAQSAAEAALTLRGRIRIDPVAIASVQVSTWDLAARMLTRYLAPGDGRTAAQFSLPYIIAVSLIDGTMGVDQLSPERLSEPAVHALAEKVTVISDGQKTSAYPDHTFAEVTVHMTDGNVHNHTVDAPRGDPRRGFEPAILREKFLDLTSGILSGHEQQALIAAVENLERHDTLAPLLAPLANLSRRVSRR